jgi:hypothetical protein
VRVIIVRKMRTIAEPTIRGRAVGNSEVTFGRFLAESWIGVAKSLFATVVRKSAPCAHTKRTTFGWPVIRPESMPSAEITSYKPVLIAAARLDYFRFADHPRTDYDQITVRSMLAIVVRPVSAIKRGESRDCAPRNEYPSASDCHSSLLRLRL